MKVFKELARKMAFILILVNLFSCEENYLLQVDDAGTAFFLGTNPNDECSAAQSEVSRVHQTSCDDIDNIQDRVLDKNQQNLVDESADRAGSIVSLADGGVTIGNGGDVILCGGKPTYVLDYILAPFKLENELVIPDENVDPQIILERLWKLNPDMAVDLQSFLTAALNDSLDNKYLWRPSDIPLVDVNDEEFAGDIEGVKDCRDLNIIHGVRRAGELDVQQIIIRTETPQLVTFHYQRQLIEGLRRHAPKQLSFLLIHEWLWSFTNSADKNRMLNHILQSNILAKLSPQGFIKILSNLEISRFKKNKALSAGLAAFNSQLSEKSSCDPTKTLVLEAIDFNEAQGAFEFQLNQGSYAGPERLCGISLLVETGEMLESLTEINISYSAFKQTLKISADSVGPYGSSFCTSSTCIAPTGQLNRFFLVKDLLQDKIFAKWQVETQSQWSNTGSGRTGQIFLLLNLSE